jgi:hypothetical protein
MSHSPHHSHPRIETYAWDEVPVIAAFTEQSADAYVVRDLDARRTVTVPKERARPDPFPPTPHQPVAGLNVLRASGYALALALMGGVGGIALGVLVALAALAGIQRFGRRARQWRRTHPGALLPAFARTEYDRLIGALWQAVLATLIGAAIVAFFVGILR